MTRMPGQRVAVWASALWWGSLATIGFLVVPMLFSNLATPAIAGAMAGKLFAAGCWVSLACGLAVIVGLRSGGAERMNAAVQVTLGFVFAGMLMALLQEFAVAPRILARDNLKLWHSVGTGLYIVQWLCACAVFWRLTRRLPAP
ncbi:MAG: DUF4149 domain-containing protein [Burkholderiales bacterium]|nr:DUF4149 domain-containing protein [Burkholderiales bacterium]